MFSDSYKTSGVNIDKVKTPEETLNWVESRFKTLDFPILHEVKRIDKNRLTIPVYVSRYSAQAASITGTRKQMGKGISEAQARASAIMELVERFSIFHFVKKREQQFKLTSEIPEPKLPLHHMLQAIHWENKNNGEEEIIQNLLMKWTKGFRPYTQSYYNTPFSWFWPINEYNGSAAGNSLEEAAVQAISEVVERHVCSLITYNRLNTPEIDQDSITHPDLLDLLDKFKKLNIKVILKDFTLDMGIPTIGAIAWDPSTFPTRSEIVYTAGTAPNPERAAIRALTEVAQLAGDFDTDGKYLESGLPKFDTLDEAAYVIESDEKVSIKELPDISANNFKQEIEAMAQALEKKGLPLYLIDITHDGLKVPAIYAIIPGNHFRDRTLNIEFPYHAARIAISSDIDSSYEALNLIDKHFPNRYDIAFYKGYVLEEKGLFQDALNWYEKALQLSPEPIELASIYCHRANCLKGLNKYEEALDELAKAEKYNDALKEIYNLKGYCFFKLDRHLEAIEAFEKAISIDPGSAIDYANIGSNLDKLGLKEAASRWYEMALELDPELDWVREKLAKLDEEKTISSTTG